MAKTSRQNYRPVEEHLIHQEERSERVAEVKKSPVSLGGDGPDICEKQKPASGGKEGVFYARL